MVVHPTHPHARAPRQNQPREDNCCKRARLLKNSFLAFSITKFARKLLNVRSPQALKFTEITALVPFSNPQAITLRRKTCATHLESVNPAACFSFPWVRTPLNAKPAKTKTPAINVLTICQHVVHLGTLRNSFTASTSLV
jgi:hypothetical protein